MYKTCIAYRATEYSHISGQYHLRRRDDQWRDVITSNFCSHNNIGRRLCKENIRSGFKERGNIDSLE
jgi:hypothetical protein